MLLLLFTLFSLNADPYLGQDYSSVWPEFSTKNPIVLNTIEGPAAYNFQPNSMPKDIETIGLSLDYEIEGQKAFVMNYKDSFTLVHELFHLHQRNRFKLPEAVSYPALYDSENQALMQVEEEILLKYAKNPSDTLKNDYLLVRQYRTGLLDEESIAFEDREERLEGLANYVAMKVTGNRAPIVKLLEGLVKDKNVIDKSLKWRFYASGALMGEMLKDKVWKSENQQLFSLFDRLQDNDRLAQLLNEYHFLEKKGAMSSQLEKLLAGIEQLRSDYKKTKGHEIQINFASSPSSGGTVDKILALNEKEKVALKESGRTESEEWVLETRQIPFIFKTREALIFKMSDKAKVDGEELNLQDIREPRPFKEITWNDRQSKFISKKEGVLIPHENSLEIRFLVSD